MVYEAKRICPKLVIIESDFAHKVGGKIVELIVELQLVRMNIIRGIKAALLLSLDDDNFIDDIEKKVKKHLFAKFLNVLTKNISVSCSGGSQYGYPNYTFRGKNGESFRASEPEGLYLMKKAVEERKNNLELLMQIGKEILYEVYMEDKRDEVFYYVYPDFYEDDLDSMCTPLINKGIANSTEEIIEKYGDDAYDLYDKFKSIFDEKQEEEEKEYCYDKF